MSSAPRILIPYNRHEALTLRQAAEISGKSVETIRRWCALHDIGRRVGGQWAVSHPALLMMLDGDRAALKAYLVGDRKGPLVHPYFNRLGLGASEAQPAPVEDRFCQWILAAFGSATPNNVAPKRPETLKKD